MEVKVMMTSNLTYAVDTLTSGKKQQPDDDQCQYSRKFTQNAKRCGDSVVVVVVVVDVAADV